MTKAVYRPGELELLGDKIVLDPPTSFPELAHLNAEEEEPEETAEETPAYTGPTADELRAEAEEFKAQWEDEKAAMLQSAKSEAARIVKQAEETAAQELAGKEEEAETVARQAQEESTRLVAEATERARQMEADAQASVDARRREAEEQGRAEGREAGFAEGKAEADRLVERTRTILERAQGKRAEILRETEGQIVDLVLLIARKVVKVISDSQRDVIVQNVTQALGKVRARGSVIIRVNAADLNLTTEHLKDFITRLEGNDAVQVQEDTSVDRGGCVIETDFGEIDARISSQLAELEAKILEISPIRAPAAKPAPAPASTAAAPGA